MCQAELYRGQGRAATIGGGLLAGGELRFELVHPLPQLG